MPSGSERQPPEDACEKASLGANSIRPQGSAFALRQHRAYASCCGSDEGLTPAFYVLRRGVCVRAVTER